MIIGVRKWSSGEKEASMTTLQVASPPKALSSWHDQGNTYPADAYKSWEVGEGKRSL